MNNTAEIENDMTETDLDELLLELEDDAVEKPQGRSFWKNLYRSWTRPKAERKFALRMQQLAGIISTKTVAAVILPDGKRIEFTTLPPVLDVIRYKIAGFIYETYE